jgi:hypothetical protein
VEYEDLYTLSDDGAALIEVGNNPNLTGEVTGFAPPGDIHRVRNAGDSTAISLHIYGTDLNRIGSSAPAASTTSRFAPPEHGTDRRHDMSKPSMQPNEVSEVLNRPMSQELLARDVTRLGYVAKDGTPRTIPIGFTWNGAEIVMCMSKNAPKLTTLRHNPAAALRIDTEMHPPTILLIRGRAELDVVEGIPEEYLQINGSYTMTAEQRAEWEAEIRSLYDGRIGPELPKLDAFSFGGMSGPGCDGQKQVVEAGGRRRAGEPPARWACIASCSPSWSSRTSVRWDVSAPRVSWRCWRSRPAGVVPVLSMARPRVSQRPAPSLACRAGAWLPGCLAVPAPGCRAALAGSGACWPGSGP